MTVVHCARLIDKLLLRSLQLLRVCSQGAVHDVNRKKVDVFCLVLLP